MITKFFRLLFLSVIFVCGVLIGGIYTPEISTFSKAENQQKKDKSHGVKPTKRKQAKKQRVVQLSSEILIPDHQHHL